MSCATGRPGRLTPFGLLIAATGEAAGGRADEWRIRVELPRPLDVLDRSAGLDHRELTARSLYCSGDPGQRRTAR